MTKSLKFSVIWFILLFILFIPFTVASNVYQKWINVVGDELFAIYQDYMPLSSASIESIGAYTFYIEKDEVKSKVGDNFRFFFAEEASKDAENARKWMPFLAITLFTLVGIGFGGFVIFIILGILRSIKTKRIDAKYLKNTLIFFLGIIIVIGIFSYQSSIESKKTIDMSNKLYDIGEYSTNIVYKFVELSNLFYEISNIEKTEYQEQGAWLSKMALAKKKNESLLKELESIKKWSVPKDTHCPRYEDIISPAIELCCRLNKYFELSTNISLSITEREMSRAESYAEFSELLETLLNALKGAIKYNGIFMKYIFEFNYFNKDALIKFHSMDNYPPETKYNLKLLFSYTVYKEIKKKADAEEAYEKKDTFLKNK